MEKERKIINQPGNKSKSSSTSSSTSTSTSSSKKYNIRGRVNAISSIITIVPKDPFALIELYDPNHPSTTTTIILKGINALTCQPGIQPGDDITFQHIIR
jgi:hypothetical protein